MPRFFSNDAARRQAADAQPAARFEPLEPRQLLSAEPLQILAIGDSLTLGVGSPDQSYRKELTARLDAQGIQYDMVGALTNGQGYDSQFYGVQGGKARDTYTGPSGDFRPSLYDGFRNGDVLSPGQQPDIILLHIGTNGATRNPQYSADELKDLLNEMARQWRAGTFDADVRIFLAQLVPGGRADDRTVDQQEVVVTEQYNDLIPGVVAQLADREFANRIQLVDFFQADVNRLGLSSSEYAQANTDGDPWVDWFNNVDEANPRATATANDDLMRPNDYLHPTPLGYKAMGAIWHNALNDAGALTQTTPPVDPPSNPTPTPTPTPSPNPLPPLVRDDLPGNFAIGARGDFNGDGKNDYIFRDRDSDATLIRLSENGRVGVETAGPNVNDSWGLRSRSDFNGDGRDDLLWVSQTGQVAVWLMNGTQPDVRIASQTAQRGASYANVRDVDGDGQQDIIWRTNRGPVYWLMRNGNLNRIDRSAVQSNTPTTPTTPSPQPTGFVVAATGDFDGDGQNDDQLRHHQTNGQTQFVSDGQTANGWTMAANNVWTISAADYDNNGTTDLRWSKPGETIYWLMDGVQFNATTNLNNLPTPTQQPTQPGNPTTPTGDFDVFYLGHSLIDTRTAYYVDAIADNANQTPGDPQWQFIWGAPLLGHWQLGSTGQPSSGVNALTELRSNPYEALVLATGTSTLTHFAHSDPETYATNYALEALKTNPNMRLYLYNHWPNIGFNNDGTPIYAESPGPYTPANTWAGQVALEEQLTRDLAAAVTANIRAVGYNQAPAVQVIPVAATLAETQRRLGNNTFDARGQFNNLQDLFRFDRTDYLGRPDSLHLNDTGMFFAAATTYATLYNANPAAANLPTTVTDRFGNTILSIDAQLARNIGNLAWQVVQSKR